MGNGDLMKCCVCGTELEFLEYGSKTGKDGKPAKWPIYAPCPNKANHRTMQREKAPAPVPQGRPSPVPREIVVPEGIPTTRALRTGLSFQWEMRDTIDIQRPIKKYADRTGQTPVSARCNIDHYPVFLNLLSDCGIDVDLKADLSFTPNWPRIDFDL